jgi:hypothetical protein
MHGQPSFLFHPINDLRMASVERMAVAGVLTLHNNAKSARSQKFWQRIKV